MSDLHPSRGSLSKPRPVDFEPDDALSYNHELDISAQRFLDSHPRLADLAENLDGDTASWIESAAKIVKRVTRSQYLNAVGFAYSIWLRSEKNPGFQNYISALRQKRRKANKHTTNLHLIVGDVIDYGDDGSNNGDGDHRRLRNRDVDAIRFLHHKKIGPNEIEDYAGSSIGRLDTWSRAWPKIKRASQNAPGEKLADPQMTIGISVRSIDAAGKASREHFTVIDDEDVRLLIDKLRERKVERQVKASNHIELRSQRDQLNTIPRSGPRSKPPAAPRARTRVGSDPKPSSGPGLKPRIGPSSASSGDLSLKPSTSPSAKLPTAPRARTRVDLTSSLGAGPSPKPSSGQRPKPRGGLSPSPIARPRRSGR